MRHFFAELLASILAHVSSIGVLTIGGWILARRHLFGALPRYRKEVRDQLKMMPFIYADLQGEVLNDYVEVEMHALDGTSYLGPSGGRRLLRDRERLQRNRRVIFLGDAGVGKTTYQRYAILSLLKRSAATDFVYSGEFFIPVYVPLKLVDNSEPFPVLRFLVNRHSLFKTPAGVYRLGRYAAQRRLFLFLDGYDEISADGTANHVREELTQLFGPIRARGTDSHNYRQSPIVNTFNIWFSRKRNAEALSQTDLISLAQALRSCRIWLSSRREFFEHNAIAIDVTQGPGPESVAAIEIGGVGSNRLRLTKNIFDKYRRREIFYQELLNEEFFISEIDRSLDDDVRAMSYNPLFLTVMCFVYVSQVAKRRQYDAEWLKQGFEDLILECVRLLLIDLDESKARDLPAAHREGLLRRRNAYTVEKEAFLMYFAAELLFDGVGTFTLEILRKSVRTFFQSETWATKSEILNQMGEVKSGRPDFALQLVYSGLFITVMLVDREHYYDFPHRRFREALALRYVRTAPRYCRALLQAERLYFGEFLRLLQASDLVQQRDFQLSALQYILQMAAHSSDKDRDVTASKNFFHLVPSALDFAPEVTLWIRQMLNDQTPRFDVSSEVILACKGDQNLASTFIRILEDSMSMAARERFALAMRSLELAWPSVAAEALQRLGQRMMDDSSTRVSASQAILRLTPALIPSCIERCTRDGEFARDCFYALAVSISRKWTGAVKFGEIFGLVPTELLRSQLLGFVGRFAGGSFELACKAAGVDVKIEWLEFLSTLGPAPSELDDRAGPIYLRTDAARLTLAKKLSDLDTVYVRAEVDEKLWDKEVLRFKQSRTTVHVVPVEFVSVVKDIVAKLDEPRASRIDQWPVMIHEIRQQINEWARRLGVQNHDKNASLRRDAIKAADFADWLLQDVDKEVVVSRRRLKELAPAITAWEYRPYKVSEFFI